MNFTTFNRTYDCLLLSCPERSVSAVQVLLYVCAFAVVLLTVCGNMLVIISVCHFKQLHTPTNMVVLSLAVSDFLVGVFVFPGSLIWMIESCWIFSSAYCVCLILISYFLINMSIYNVALIAVDRYLALSNPFLYAEAISLNAMSFTVLSLWLFLLLYNFTLQYFNGYFASTVMCPGVCFLVLDEIWSLVDLVLSFVFPCSVIIVFYGMVFVIARKHANAIRDLASKKASDSMKSERKAAKVLSVLVAVFMACLLPYFIYSTLGYAVEIEAESFQKVLMLVYLNSTINPVIYGLFYPWFRKCVRLILTFQVFQTDSSLIIVL